MGSRLAALAAVDGASSLRCMADAAQKEPVAPRIAAVREQLSLLSDYL
jgi:hypothetical protein